MSGIKNLLLAGGVVGFVFGIVDLILTFFNPLEDDTPEQLLLFYGPMFLVWIVISFQAARRTGTLSSGVAAGMSVAFTTFCVFVVFNFLRVNLFLNQLTERADWQNMDTQARRREQRGFLNDQGFRSHIGGSSPAQYQEISTDSEQEQRAGYADLRGEMKIFRVGNVRETPIVCDRAVHRRRI